MADKIKELLEKNGQMIIDGSMSTALEQMGANLNCNLWTARALVDTPELVKKVHTDYFKAGADCGITCSYQATIPGLMENGYRTKQRQRDSNAPRSDKLNLQRRRLIISRPKDPAVNLNQILWNLYRSHNHNVRDTDLH